MGKNGGGDSFNEQKCKLYCWNGQALKSTLSSRSRDHSPIFPQIKHTLFSKNNASQGRKQRKNEIQKRIRQEYV